MAVSQRKVMLLGFLVSVALMATALYFQYGKGLEPCPLCIMQRIAVISAGLVLLIGAIHNPAAVGRRIYGALVVLAGGFGLAMAWRNVWLQHLPPDQVPSCGPGLSYMLETFPFHKALLMVFRGTGDCAVVDWTFLSFSIAEWMLLFFSAYIVAGLILLFSRRLWPR